MSTLIMMGRAKERAKSLLFEPGDTLSQRVVRGGLFVAASSYFNIGFGFLANLVLTRLLAPKHFGFLSLSIFLLAYIRA